MENCDEIFVSAQLNRESARLSPGSDSPGSSRLSARYFSPLQGWAAARFSDRLLSLRATGIS